MDLFEPPMWAQWGVRGRPTLCWVDDSATDAPACSLGPHLQVSTRALTRLCLAASCIVGRGGCSNARLDEEPTRLFAAHAFGPVVCSLSGFALRALRDS